MPIVSAFVMPHPPLVVPEVGGGQEKRVGRTVESMHAAARQIAHAEPETVVVISPHSVMYGDYIHISPGKDAHGDFGQFGAKQAVMHKKYDTEFVSALCDRAFDADIPAGALGEKNPALDHATMVPLYFVDQYLRSYKIVRIGISGLPYLTHYRLGQCIAQAADELDQNIAVIGSGDLSHKLKDTGPYGYDANGPRFDDQVTDALRRADFLQLLKFKEHFCEAAGECGLRSFIMMAGTLDGMTVDTQFLSYEGPFGVGYAVCGYTITGDDESRCFGDVFEAEQRRQLEERHQNEDAYVRLARLSLETYVKSSQYAALPDGLSEDLTEQKAGVFVSLKKHGRLRGCIGTTTPTKDSIAAEIVANAVSAGTGDPRFEPVREEELGELVYSVDVLGKPEDISGIDELDAKKYGVIVSKGFRRGLLLPNLDGVDTVQEQVSIAKQKAGLGESDDVKLQRFKVVRHK